MQPKKLKSSVAKSRIPAGRTKSGTSSSRTSRKKIPCSDTSVQLGLTNIAGSLDFTTKTASSCPKELNTPQPQQPSSVSATPTSYMNCLKWSETAKPQIWRDGKWTTSLNPSTTQSPMTGARTRQ